MMILHPRPRPALLLSLVIHSHDMDQFARAAQDLHIANLKSHPKRPLNTLYNSRKQSPQPFSQISLAERSNQSYQK